MKKLVMVLSLVVALAALTACVEKATPELCQAACAQKIALMNQGVEDAGAKIAAVEQGFKAQFDAVNAKIAEAVAPIETDYAAKIEKAKKQEEKDKLAAEKETKVQEATAALQAELQTLNQGKADAIAKVQTEEEARRAAQAKELDGCKAACAKDGTKPKAECQKMAKDLNAWNACK